MRLKSLNRSSKIKLSLSLGNNKSTAIKAHDLKTDVSYTYHSIRYAAKSLNIKRGSIINYLFIDNKLPVINRYTFELINLSNINYIKNIKQKTAKKIEVIDVINNNTIVYDSIGTAAKSLGLYQASISLYLKKGRTNLFKGKYIFKLII